jgi:chromate transporter
LRSNPMGWKLCGAYALLTFAAIGLLRWPMVGVVLGLGSVAVLSAWVRIGR